MPLITLPGSGELAPGYLLSVREFRKKIGRPVLVLVELELEGTDPARSGIRALLRVLDKDLLSSTEVDLLNTDTVEGIYGLAALGFITMSEAQNILTP